ncbi:MAG: DUF4349 domain-containing protein [Thermoleophilia bacterium]
MRPRDTLTPEQERDLDAIDRALSGDPVEYELRGLEQLVLDVRATAPQMSPAFAARLEHEVSEGFPAPRALAARLRLRLPARRPLLLLPAVGSLAAVLVALVVVLGGGSGTRDLAGGDDSAQTSRAPGQVEESRASRDQLSEQPGAGSGAAAPEPAPPSAGRALPAPPAVDSTQAARKVQRSATIALETPAGEFERTTAAVNATVARFGGVVASAQTAQSEAAGGEATYDLRIPTSRLDRALAALARLGHVTERSQGLQDITSSFTSARERLTDARAERRGLLRALERATTQAQVDGLRARLRSVGGQINALKARLESLRSRADLARVDLTVRATGDSTQTGGGGSWTPGDAAGDALRVLEVVAGVLLIALAVLVPAGLLAAVVAAGIRLGRRRRREAALDPA